VRGEFMAPWGVAETLRLGLTDVLLRAGGGYTARIVVYDEGVPRDVAEANALPLQGLVPGVRFRETIRRYLVPVRRKSSERATRCSAPGNPDHPAH